MLTQESPLLLTFSGLSLFVILFIMMWYMEWFPAYYFHLHSEDVVFFDTYRLDSRDKALSALVANFVLTAVNVYIRRTVSSWQINYVNSPHIARSELQSTLHIQLTMLFYTLFVCLSGAINIFLIFSNFWFLMVQTTSTVIVTLVMTQLFLKEKALAESVKLPEDDLGDVDAEFRETPQESARNNNSTKLFPDGPNSPWTPLMDTSLASTAAEARSDKASSIRRGVLHI